jgi:hypothetical protein
VLLGGALLLCGEGDADADLSLFGKLNGVAYHVDEDLAKAAAVCDDAFGDVFFDMAMEQDAGFHCTAYKYFQHFFDAAAKVGFFFFEDYFTGFECREVENIIDDGEQCVAASLDDVRVTALFFCECRLVQESCHAEDAIHRGSYFVAHVGEEDTFCTLKLPDADPEMTNQSQEVYEQKKKARQNYRFNG